MKNNQLGQKIKRLRKKMGLTQSELVGTKITRNMLSSIESGVANPSLETLEYIADRLSVSVSYLISEDEDLLTFEKKESMDLIYRAYLGKNYAACIRLINSMSDIDDELAFLLSSSYLEMGENNVSSGSLISASKNLEEAIRYTEKTRLDTSGIEAKAHILLSIAKNIQSPLLEFDSNKYTSALMRSCNFELYKYLTQDFSYSFTTPAFSLHIEAKELIKERNYQDAIKLLLNAQEITKEDSYNAFLIFGIYTDLEYCYKQLYDYEKAYLYSTKRITLLEGFKS